MNIIKTKYPHILQFTLLLVLYLVSICLIFNIFYQKRSTEEMYSAITAPAKPDVEKITKIAQISAWHLMGQTKLISNSRNLNKFKLLGIIFNQEGSTVILDVDGKEQFYKEGAKLQNNIVIKHIDRSSITLETNQGAQRLDLFEK